MSGILGILGMFGMFGIFGERHASREVCSQVMMKFASCDKVCGDLWAIAYLIDEIRYDCR